LIGETEKEAKQQKQILYWAKIAGVAGIIGVIVAVAGIAMTWWFQPPI
jgi:predicted negative regulator of RcsB-dependent stress response